MSLTTYFDVSYSGFAEAESWRVSHLGELTSPSNSCGADSSKPVRQVYPAVDTFTCDGRALTVTHHGHEVLCTADTWTPVVTRGSYCHGVVECTVQIPNHGGGLFLGVAAENCEKKTEKTLSTRAEKFLGWFSADFNAGFCIGDNTKLGQPWTHHDVITLRLDSDHHMLTAIHKRTGQSHTIPVPAGKLCFAAELYPRTAMKFMT
eukprot:scpid98124/ scgid20005/ 